MEDVGRVAEKYAKKAVDDLWLEDLTTVDIEELAKFFQQAIEEDRQVCGRDR